jgi:hypothetical protein
MPTILNQLTTELSQDLRFYHKGVTNVSRPKQPHRVGDKISFDVFVKNNSSIVAMKSIAGWIKHAAATSFTSVSFSVPSLGPGEEKQLGSTITAEVVANTNDSWLADKIALIDANGTVDLSKLGFSDSGVLVDFIQNG